MENQKKQLAPGVAEQMNQNGDCHAEVDLGTQSPFHYDEKELAAMDWIRSLYPKASDKVVRGVFESLKKGRSPQTEQELIAWMDKLVAAHTISELLG